VSGVVHYLVSDPDRGGGLVHPREVIDPENQSYGTFHVEVDEDGTPDGRYGFDILDEDEVRTIPLVRVDGRRYAAAVEGLGSFVFTVADGIPSAYAGSAPDGPKRVLLPLKVDESEDLEITAMFYGITFVGRSTHPNGTGGTDEDTGGKA
jgi:hypothetical protein